MTKISELDLGSALLAAFILIGFIATAFVFIRLSIIAINYIKENSSNQEQPEDKSIESNKKGF